MRHAFDKCGGSLGTTGSVAFQFEKKGIIVIDAEGKDEDTVMEDALDAGAEDFSNEGEAFEVTTSPGDFSAVREALEAKGYEFLSAELEMVPSNTVTLDEAQTKQFEKMIDMLEDNDDVQNVFHNAELVDIGE